MQNRRMESLLLQTRISRGLSLSAVAQAVEANEGTISRIERGLQTPQRELARKLFVFYNGVVPLGLIYDASFGTHETVNGN